MADGHLARFSLAGRRALVTGAGIGIGLATAQVLAASGASVVLHHHRHRDDAERVAAAIRSRGGKAVALGADLSDAHAAERLVDRSIEALGGLDVLVNSAGVTLSRSVQETDADAFDWLYRLNVRGAFLCIRRALTALARSGHGSVVNMTSTHGAAGFAGHAAYASTKGALIAMTRELAIELAPRRIRVNAIGPGVVEVPRYYDIPGYTRELGERLSPLGRVGLPEDVAEGILYLASDASSFVTGHVLWIDGGMLAKMALEWEREDITT